MGYTQEDYERAKAVKKNHWDGCWIQTMTMEELIEEEGNIECKCFDS